MKLSIGRDVSRLLGGTQAGVVRLAGHGGAEILQEHRDAGKRPGQLRRQPPLSERPRNARGSPHSAPGSGARSARWRRRRAPPASPDRSDQLGLRGCVHPCEPLVHHFPLPPSGGARRPLSWPKRCRTTSLASASRRPSGAGEPISRRELPAASALAPSSLSSRSAAAALCSIWSPSWRPGWRRRPGGSRPRRGRPEPA